jgi:hypothetical protein
MADGDGDGDGDGIAKKWRLTGTYSTVTKLGRNTKVYFVCTIVSSSSSRMNRRLL